MEYTDAEMIGRLQNDDRTAFNNLYWKHSHKIYLNALKLTKDRTAAEDVVQDVFIILWEKRLSIDPSKPVLNWIFIVSYHKSLDYLRKSLKTALVSDDSRHSSHYPQADPPIEDHAIKEHQLHLIESAIQQLSPQRKKVFEICKIQGESYESAAHRLNISKHTVKEYLCAAMKNIKEYVSSYEPVK